MSVAPTLVAALAMAVPAGATIEPVPGFAPVPEFAPVPVVAPELPAAAPKRDGRRSSEEPSPRPGGRVATRAIAAVSLASVAVLLVLEVVAAVNHYAMRVGADTPTFMALIRDLALHPLRPDSVFFGTADTRSLHASPYLQGLGVVWREVAPGGRLSDPYALGTFLGLAGIPVTLFVLAMLWRYARSLAGTRAAWLSLPVLLVALGPAHIIFSSDLSLNGFLATGYYPTTLATGLTLATLLVLERRAWPWMGLAVLLTALTLSTDLLSGAVLVVLMIVTACVRAPRQPDQAVRIPIVLLWAFVLAGAWPGFDLIGAFAASGLPVPAIVGAAVLAPLLTMAGARRLSRRPRLVALWRLIVRVLRTPISASRERRVAVFGARAAGVLLVYSLLVMGHWPTDHPALASYRLGFYWNDQRDRWLLLFLPAAVGVIGLWRLAGRGRPVPLLWFVGFIALGSLGAAVHLATGHTLPFYYRFFLVAQVPVAVGVAAFLAHHRSRRAAWIVAATLAGIFVYKATTLIVVPNTVSYFGDQLQSAWSLGRVIPPGPGLVAADPATSYYVPMTTGHHVLTLSPGHADSGAEPERTQLGYRLLRQVYTGTPAQAAAAIREMWAVGVRWVVVEKYTTFTPGDVKTLFAAPYNGLITGGDAGLQARYNSRLSAVGHEVANSSEYSVYRLDEAALFAATTPAPNPSPARRALVAEILKWLARGDLAAARLAAPQLARRGVQRVTLTMGTLGDTPQLTAYGPSIATAPVASVAITSGRWVSDCVIWCRHQPDTSALAGLGTVIHDDPRFSTIVRLP